MSEKHHKSQGGFHGTGGGPAHPKAPADLARWRGCLAPEAKAKLLEQVQSSAGARSRTRRWEQRWLHSETVQETAAGERGWTILSSPSHFCKNF